MPSNAIIAGVFVAAVAALAASAFVPSPYATVVSMPYHGETVGPFQIRLPMTGHYTVGLRIPHDDALIEAMDRQDPPIDVTVMAGDAPVGEATNDGGVGDDITWSAYRFSGREGNLANVIVRPGVTWNLFAKRNPTLEIKRIPTEYTQHFLMTTGFRALAAVLVLVGGVMLLAARRRA